MKTREEALSYGLSFPDTYQEAPFHDPNWQLVRVKGTKRAFLWTYERNGHVNLNVKVSPEWRDFWRDTYPAVTAAYHQNKEHWNTVILDGSVSDGDVKRMIAESYDLVTDSPTRRIYEAVKKIPAGKVATYGQIAGLSGDKKMARAVGNAMRKNPWGGRSSLPPGGQRQGRAGRRICVRGGSKPGGLAAGRGRGSNKGQGGFGQIRDITIITKMKADRP